MKMTLQGIHFDRRPLYAAIVGGLVAVGQPAVLKADTTTNPDPAAKPLVLAQSCNPCATKKACNPCNPCNPCAAKKACNPCNPCAAKKACNPCNPCNPCKTSSACNPCNPCGAAKGATMRVSGVLVDTRCYGFNNKNVSNEHIMGGGAKVAGCAAACAKMGIPVAVLEGGIKGGALFTIASPAPGFAPYMGMEARLTGTEVVNGLVLPTQLEVKKGNSWQKVNVKGMM